MATDHTGAVYTALADAMTRTGSETFAAGVRKFIRFDGTNPQPGIVRNQQPGDTPEIRFRLERVQEQLAPETAARCSRVVTFVATFSAKIICDNVRLLPATAAHAGILADIASLETPPPVGDGYDLGIEGCQTRVLATDFRPRANFSDPDAPNRNRLVSELLIPVRISFVPGT